MFRLHEHANELKPVESRSAIVCVCAPASLAFAVVQAARLLPASSDDFSISAFFFFSCSTFVLTSSSDFCSSEILAFSSTMPSSFLVTWAEFSTKRNFKWLRRNSWCTTWKIKTPITTTLRPTNAIASFILVSTGRHGIHDGELLRVTCSSQVSDLAHASPYQSAGVTGNLQSGLPAELDGRDKPPVSSCGTPSLSLALVGSHLNKHLGCICIMISLSQAFLL